jgi:5-methylcytosine-specific restriction endonuclease McrA
MKIFHRIYRKDGTTQLVLDGKLRTRITTSIKYGPRCWFDDSFRKKCVRRLALQRRRKKYGSGCLMNQKRKAAKKKKLLWGQEGKCSWCGKPFYRGQDIEIDHIIRISDGGKANIQNLQLLHSDCHKKKELLYDRLKEQGRIDDIKETVIRFRQDQLII